MRRLSLWLALCLMILPVALTAQAQLWCVSMPQRAAPCHHRPENLQHDGPLPDCCRIAPAPALAAVAPVATVLKIKALPVFAAPVFAAASQSEARFAIRIAPPPPPVYPPAPPAAPLPLRI
jgi:hypothetical protein